MNEATGENKVLLNRIYGNPVNGQRFKYAIGNVLAMNDFISMKLVENAKGDITVVNEDGNLGGVLSQTELPTALENGNIKTINGISKQLYFDILSDMGGDKVLVTERFFNVVKTSNQLDFMTKQLIINTDTNEIVSIIGIDEAITNLPSNYKITPFNNINVTTLVELKSVFSKVPGGISYLEKLSVDELNILRLIKTINDNPAASFPDEMIKNLNLKAISNIASYGKWVDTLIKYVKPVAYAGLVLSAAASVAEASEAYELGDYKKGDNILASWASSFVGAVSAASVASSAITALALTVAVTSPLAGVVTLFGLGMAVATLGSYIGDSIVDIFPDLFPNVANWLRGVFGIAESSNPPRVDPLVLDMAGNNFNPTTLQNGVNFDLDQNGFAEKMSWISEDDVFLAIDRNNDGTINNGSELFGDKMVLDGKKVNSGFEALMSFDSNGDGVLDKNDEGFGKILVWGDSNSNGISEKGELRTLTDAGIASINLAYTMFDELTSSGVLLKNTATFTRHAQS